MCTRAKPPPFVHLKCAPRTAFLLPLNQVLKHDDTSAIFFPLQIHFPDETLEITTIITIHLVFHTYLLDTLDQAFFLEWQAVDPAVIAV